MRHKAKADVANILQKTKNWKYCYKTINNVSKK